MYPHERSLVKRLADEPFAIIGVNSDTDREALEQTLQDEQITWRSFWNGGSTGGSLSSAWNIHGWPTLCVLDAQGRIRYRDVRASSWTRPSTACWRRWSARASRRRASSRAS